MQQMDHAYKKMTADMTGKLNTYFHSLQERFGDPAVYAMQRQEMEAERAVIAHGESRSREELLKVAYNDNRKRAREAHSARMSSSPQPPSHNTPPQSLTERPG